MENKLIQTDPSDLLKTQSNARIGLGNVGGALPTQQTLSIKLDHARAKDAVFSPLNTELLADAFSEFDLPFFNLKSKAENKIDYLKRPDLGRRLDYNSLEILEKSNEKPDILLVITDGLSAEAVNRQVINVLKQLIPEWSKKHKIALALVENGRVAIADEIGERLGAKFTAIFIGERPGLSSPHSMGIYTTFQPKVGLTDESRNCISNIHPDGLSILQTVQILNYYKEESFRNEYSGFKLKLELNLFEEQKNTPIIG
ncbi:MAG: ethanolamine ammonia-lyase subunit EutC [Spirosomataceae bacterium]|jgi:ethanolamine ammonia-lyase small subunit